VETILSCSLIGCECRLMAGSLPSALNAAESGSGRIEAVKQSLNVNPDRLDGMGSRGYDSR
jgi:hypothetical protein